MATTTQVGLIFVILFAVVNGQGVPCKDRNKQVVTTCGKCLWFDECEWCPDRLFQGKSFLIIKTRILMSNLLIRSTCCRVRQERILPVQSKDPNITAIKSEKNPAKSRASSKILETIHSDHSSANQTDDNTRQGRSYRFLRCCKNQIRKHIPITNILTLVGGQPGRHVFRHGPLRKHE